MASFPPHAPPGQVPMSALAAAMVPAAWVPRSCGEGAQGPRVWRRRHQAVACACHIRRRALAAAPSSGACRWVD